MQGRETVALPLKADTTSQARLVTLHILKVLPFNVQTLKSGVVIQADHDHAGSNTGLLFVRGAAGVIKSLVQPGFLPKDFDKVQGIRYMLAWAQAELQRVANALTDKVQGRKLSTHGTGKRFLAHLNMRCGK